MSKIQSIAFDKKLYTKRKAYKWAINHHFIPKKVSTEVNYIKVRLENPSKFKSYITKDIGNGILLVIGFY